MISKLNPWLMCEGGHVFQPWQDGAVCTQRAPLVLSLILIMYHKHASHHEALKELQFKQLSSH